MPTSPADDTTTAERVKAYYHSRESRWGYQLVLGGTKHFGFYRPGQSRWAMREALRNAEHELAKTLDLPRGSKVLDAGCGMGEVATNLALWRDWHVTGLDLLDFNIEEAARRARRKGVVGLTEFREGSYVDGELGSEVYDGAYTMETLTHIGDTERALANLHRALKPGGRLVGFEYAHVGYDEMPPAAARAIQEVNRVAAMPSFDRFAPGEHARLLGEAGFTEITVVDVTERMLPMLHAFSSLAGAPYAVAKRLGKHEHAINAMSAVEFWKWRGCWSYNIVTCTKPARTAH